MINESFGSFARELDALGHGMAGFERGEDAFGRASAWKAAIASASVARRRTGATAVLEPRVFRAHAGIIEAGTRPNASR